MLEHPAHLTESNDDFFRTLLRYKYDTLEKNTLDLCIVFLSQFLQRGEKNGFHFEWRSLEYTPRP